MSDYKFQRPLTDTEVSTIVEAMEQSATSEEVIENLFIEVWNVILTEVHTTTFHEVDFNITPWEYALPVHQTTDLLTKASEIMRKIDNQSEHQSNSDFLSLNLFWMNKGPSSYEEKENA